MQFSNRDPSQEVGSSENECALSALIIIAGFVKGLSSSGVAEKPFDGNQFTYGQRVPYVTSS